MSGDGQNAHKIYSSDKGTIYLPEWSPDGRRIAFTQIAYVVNPEPTQSNYPDFTSVVVVDVTGHELVRVPRVAMAHWSPGGSYIATLRDFGVGQGAFFVGTPAVIQVSDGSLRDIAVEIRGRDAPRWSPDGSWLAYATDTDGVFVLPADMSAAARRVLEGGESTYHGAFVWADNSTLVALEDRSGDFSPSYVFVNIDSSAVQRSVPNQKATACGRESAPGDYQPIVFGDGRYLAWPMQCQAPSGFWLQDISPADESYPRFFQVPDNGSVVVLSASPDGRHVLYSGAGIVQPVHRTSPTPVPARTPTGSLIWMVDLDAGQGTSVLLGQTGTQAVWSP
jgi:Tol biopolymer transport system component